MVRSHLTCDFLSAAFLDLNFLLVGLLQYAYNIMWTQLLGNWLFLQTFIFSQIVGTTIRIRPNSANPLFHAALVLIAISSYAIEFLFSFVVCGLEWCIYARIVLDLCYSFYLLDLFIFITFTL